MSESTSGASAARVAIVTGANTGIGEVTARELARQGFHTFLACRNVDKAEQAKARMIAAVPSATIEILPLDLSSLEAVRQSAASFLARELPVDVLVNNAGLAGQRGQTKDGFELAFGVNHLGPFLFTRLLEERVKQAAKKRGQARIVNVASRAHVRAKGIDWDALRKPTKTVTGFPEYGVSKLCNVLFSAEHAKKLAGTGVHTYALHPGVVASDVWREVPWPVRSIMKLWMISNEEGAQTQIHCATAPERANETGLYYDKSAPKEPARLGRDEGLMRELWERSEGWVSRGS